MIATKPECLCIGGSPQSDPALPLMAGFQVSPPHSSHRESHLAHPNHMRQIPDEALIQSLTDTPQPTHSHRTSKPERSQDHLEQLPFAYGETKSQEREDEVGWEPGPSQDPKSRLFSFWCTTMHHFKYDRFGGRGRGKNPGPLRRSRVPAQVTALGCGGDQRFKFGD